MILEEKHCDILETLKTFKELSSEEKRHQELLKAKKVILYVATLLDNENIVIIRLCLDILENFISNEECRLNLVTIFGLYEAVESLAMRMRGTDEKIHQRANEITEILRNSAPPALRTRSRAKCAQFGVQRNPVFLLFIDKLNEKNKKNLENALIKIKGVVSFILDVELKKCTVRICPKVTVKEVVEKIFNKTSLKPLIVVKNVQEGTESFYDVLDSSIERSYLEYAEEDYVPRARALVTSVGRCVKTGNNLLKSIANFWNDSFYW